jgi:hypothetical protein
MPTLKRKTDAPNHVGSGDWLGIIVCISESKYTSSQARKKYKQPLASKSSCSATNETETPDDSAKASSEP